MLIPLDLLLLFSYLPTVTHLHILLYDHYQFIQHSTKLY